MSVFPGAELEVMSTNGLSGIREIGETVKMLQKRRSQLCSKGKIMLRTKKLFIKKCKLQVPHS